MAFWQERKDSGSKVAAADGACWREAFWECLRLPDHAEPLRQASLSGKLGEWTKALTAATVTTCDRIGWDAVAKGHTLAGLPIPRSEYLVLDVTAFSKGSGWKFPMAVFELENSLQDDRIAYSLWKVLCVRADLRMVFCYRRTSEQAAELVRFLRTEVVEALTIAARTNLCGETLVVVGSRAEAETFPYGFFKWWSLDNNTGHFGKM
jgi:hypothetical protein